MLAFIAVMAMMETMRSSDLRAMGQEIASCVFEKYPTSSAGIYMSGHEKEWHNTDRFSGTSPRYQASSPATVRPNVKRFNMPWKTQCDFFALGSGEPPQGVPLASRGLGEWSSEPGLEFQNLEACCSTLLPASSSSSSS